MSVNLKEHLQEVILRSTNSKQLRETEVIQNLWSGYGKIKRFALTGSALKSVVVKHVHFPNEASHPRGWNSDFSHQRKVKSYEVEVAWYQRFSEQCDELCRIPRCFALESGQDEVLMVMEDLDAAGFPVRKTSVNWEDIDLCISWLANFHATFLGEKPEGLWPIGTYWHLDTRPEELEKLEDKSLKSAAPIIDEHLNSCQYQTFVHGDAKLANFCFSVDGKSVAAVDFQYVGSGCGMKDLAYFVGSCLYEEDCERFESRILDTYFAELKTAIEIRHKQVDFLALENEWRAMYPVAWTDFHRFLKGWSPGHWKINSYSEKMERKVIRELEIKKQ